MVTLLNVSAARRRLSSSADTLLCNAIMLGNFKDRRRRNKISISRKKQRYGKALRFGGWALVVWRLLRRPARLPWRLLAMTWTGQPATQASGFRPQTSNLVDHTFSRLTSRIAAELIINM